ncbi:Metallo-beta-lactamase superfamily protein [Mycena kentingensis (nom. inval.)]|nr:Metallo-beta-lactamase superfamily protein [Mycena kentingensis (nom. inval.)]
MRSPLKFCALLALTTPAHATWQSLGIPPSNTGASITLHAFHLGQLTVPGGAADMIHPVLPGREDFLAPLYAFLLDHPSGRRVMWDIGVRKDVENAVPPLAAVFEAFPNALQQSKDIVEVLGESGVALESIEAVIHAHIDHIGDMSRFPNATDIVVGDEADLSFYVDNPKSQLQPSDLAGHNVKRVAFAKSKLAIGGLAAVDYFDDGSLYLLHTPGHRSGHMSPLVRVTTSPPSFVLLGGDAAHHVGSARPSPLLQKNFPCPIHALTHAAHAVSTEHFWSPGSALGKFDILSRAPPMLALSDLPDGIEEDPVRARVSLDKLATFDADVDVLFVIAHDASIVADLPVFPETLNGWKKRGLKEKIVWRFLEEGNPAFIFSPVVEDEGVGRDFGEL